MDKHLVHSLAYKEMLKVSDYVLSSVLKKTEWTAH